MDDGEYVFPHGEHLVDGTPTPVEHRITPLGVWPARYEVVGKPQPDVPFHAYKGEDGDDGWSTPFG